jgi:hypothetical protein
LVLLAKMNVILMHSLDKLFILDIINILKSSWLAVFY